MTNMSSLIGRVLGVALLADLATGLGVLPFAFVRKLSERWQGITAGIAGGMMISAAVFSLSDEALRRGGVNQVILGMLAGAAFFAWTARRLEHNKWHVGQLSVSDSRRSVLMIVTMFIHSIPEGVAIGVGYATGELRFGLLLAVAIAVHNIPEGMAIALPLRANEVSLWTCAGYAILTSLPQPLMAVPSFMLVSVLKPLLPAGLGFAGGAMTYLVAAELLPDSLESCSRHEMAWSFMVGLVVMLWVTAGLGL